MARGRRRLGLTREVRELLLVFEPRMLSLSLLLAVQLGCVEIVRMVVPRLHAEVLLVGHVFFVPFVRAELRHVRDVA